MTRKIKQEILTGLIHHINSHVSIKENAVILIEALVSLAFVISEDYLPDNDYINKAIAIFNEESMKHRGGAWTQKENKN